MRSRRWRAAGRGSASGRPARRSSGRSTGSFATRRHSIVWRSSQPRSQRPATSRAGRSPTPLTVRSTSVTARSATTKSGAPPERAWPRARSTTSSTNSTTTPSPAKSSPPGAAHSSLGPTSPAGDPSEQALLVREGFCGVLGATTGDSSGVYLVELVADVPDAPLEEWSAPLRLAIRFGDLPASPPPRRRAAEPPALPGPRALALPGRAAARVRPARRRPASSLLRSSSGRSAARSSRSSPSTMPTSSCSPDAARSRTSRCGRRRPTPA